ncbi:MAG: serine/threonine-protein kinase [Pseudomonadota bacterium]
MQGFPYRVVKRLPAGGMCDVLLALRQPDQRPVVLKILNAQHRANPLSVEKFLSESDLLALLEHPNVVRREDVGTFQDVPYLVLEYIPGVDLQHLLEAGLSADRLPSTGTAAYIVGELLKALAHVHRATSATGEPLGLVHRDIKPSNIMLGFDGSVRLLDFGIAVAAQVEGGQPAAVEGTLAYLAPEQVLGEPVDPRADLYAAGAVLYQLTTLEPPFGAFGEDEDTVLTQIVDGALRRPRDWVPGYDRRIEKLVLKALARKPGRRFQRAEDMAVALSDFRDPMISGELGLRSLLDLLFAERRDRLAGLVHATVPVGQRR